MRRALCWIGVHDYRWLTLVRPDGARFRGRGQICERCYKYRHTDEPIVRIG